MKRFLFFCAALAILVSAAFAEGLTAPPLWLSEVPLELPEMPRFPEFRMEDGLLILENFEGVQWAGLEFHEYDDWGRETVYSYDMAFDEARGGWYSAEASADGFDELDMLRLRTETLNLVYYNGGFVEVTLLEDGEPRYAWEYWTEPFEGMSMGDAPYISVTIYPSAEWPVETKYGGYGELERYIYTAPDGARVWYEAHDLVCVTLEKDGVPYAYTPSGGRYPAGWSTYTGNTASHHSGYTACEAPEGVNAEDYVPLIDQKPWLEAISEAFSGQ